MKRFVEDLLRGLRQAYVLDADPRRLATLQAARAERLRMPRRREPRPLSTGSVALIALIGILIFTLLRYCEMIADAPL